MTYAAPALLCYGAAYCNSIRIAFLAAALNDLNILAADVQNAYLNMPTGEKVYTIAGLEFGASNVGRPIKIV